MWKNRRILNVFLASPTDVAEERALAEEAVTRINKIIGESLGWQIDLHRWEDTRPGFGRPQEIINKTVDECELFIGLLWRSWGHPTGEYSSGFEEEFERAKARRKQQGVPEMWLFFKAVDSESLNDPGPQLRKVLDFRESQIALREVLFRDVRDTEEWKTRFHDELLKYALSMALRAQIAQEQPASALPVLSVGSTEIEASLDAGREAGVPRQLRNVSLLLDRVVEAGKLEFSREDAKLLQEFDVARLFLLSATWMSIRYTGETLGTHEMNLLYKHRKQLEVTAAERYQLFRTIVGDVHDFVPGWFWFQEFPLDAVVDWLFTLARRDSSDGVRVRALEMLAEAGIKIPTESWPELPFNDVSIAVRNQAYEYLVSVGDEKALSFLESLEANNDSLASVIIHGAKLRMLARLDASRALSEVIADAEGISENEAQALQECISEVDESVLLEGVESSSEKIRSLSLKELARRGSVPVPLAKKLTEDASLAIRAMAFESLAKQGTLPDLQELRKALSQQDSDSPSRPIHISSLMLAGRPPVSPDPDTIIVTFYRTQSTDQMLEAVDWFSVNGPLAYRALALDRYELISTHLRTDLANGFTRIKEQSVERKKSEYGVELWERHGAAFDKYDGLVRSEFTESALVGLTANGSSSEADLARPYLSHENSSLRDAAVAFICKFGNSEDVDALLKITRGAWGDVRRKAAAAALRLSAKPIEVAYELIENRDSEVVKTAFEWLFAQDSPEVRMMFRSLLRDEAATRRTRAVYYCSRWMKEKELEQLLEDYIVEETYYYDVVTWLDRLVQSPKPLRDMFMTALRQKVKGTNE